MPRPRKRRTRGRDPAGGDTDHLASPEHSWWAERPSDPLAAGDDDVGAEAVPLGTEPDEDPYAVLRVAPDAEWDDITTAYRRLARWWHPDGLTEPTRADREACELKIRRLNAAYAELRIRRGRGQGRR